jgi:3-hydroxyacyl-[acyl-carrier-protein] dehydratase
MSTMLHSEQFHIAADHPALPGHFPGAPVVPGVVLLDHVVAVAGRIWGLQVSGLPQVKFLQPLAPESPAQLTLERVDTGLRFRIQAGAQVIASGLIEVAA